MDNKTQSRSEPPEYPGRFNLIDLGVLLGVQIKTGDSFFKEPAHVDGEAGWWFRETDQRHEDYWSNHHIPHILIVQDEKRVRQFWARLDRSSIELTGKGIRVFVPDNQPLTADAAAIWTNMVSDARKLISFEGSRWNFDITELPESEWPRYALLASRISSPHPNQGAAIDINWAQAVALCMQADLRRWDNFAAQQTNVPTPEVARGLDDPGWKFAAAIYRWLVGNADELESLDTTKMANPLRVAHGIVLSTVLADRGDWEQALTLLKSLRDPDELSADQAWLLIHLGWALYESGQIDEARKVFEESLFLHAGFPSSLTNSAIRSAGILALFNLAPAFSGDLAAAVQASDSTLSWWQTQQIESGLNDFLRRSFQRWAHDSSFTFGGGDPTHNNLVSAEITARLVGDRRSSRYAKYLRATANLALPNGAFANIEDQLESLRSAGYPKELALALRHLRSEGPLSHVSAYMADVTVAHMTTTSVRADLESIKVAGSYSPREVAEEWIGHLFDAFNDPSSLRQRLNTTFDIRHEILDALAGLRLHFTAEHSERLLQLALDLPEDTTQLLEGSLRQVLNALDSAILDEHAEKISSHGLSLSANLWLGRIFVDLTANRSTDSRDAASKRILSGTLSAIPSNLRIDSLTREEADAVVLACTREILQYRGQLNGVGFGGPDAYRLVAQVAVAGPEETKPEAWNALVEGIVADDVIHDRKTDALEILAAYSDAIPEEHRTVLRQASLRFQDAPPSAFSGTDSLSLTYAGPAFAALYLELQPEDDDWRAALNVLLAGTPHQRRTGVEVLGRRSGHELLLLAMTRDTDSDVAHSAMHGLARRAAEDSSVALAALAPLRSLVAAGGEQAAIRIGWGIMSTKNRVAEIAPLVAALQSHESLQIRSLVGDLGDPDPT